MGAIGTVWRWAATAGGVVVVGLVGGCASTPHEEKSAQLIVSPTSCADFSISIYFQSGSTHLNPEANTLLAAAARQAKNCHVTGIMVTGLADKPGTPAANQALSKARTVVVTKALSQHEFADFQFAPPVSDSGSPSQADSASPLRRRADVLFHLVPRS